MAVTFPGTTIEASVLEKGSSRQLFDGIFATGGITLSQISVMTGLEPYMIQNWVKRGFVSPPKNRVYSRDQFARIVIINMLRESLQLDKICHLIHAIQGNDNIPDDALYHHYVDMLSDPTVQVMEVDSVELAANKVAESCTECASQSRNQLSWILQAMVHAHYASQLRATAEEYLARLR